MKAREVRKKHNDATGIKFCDVEWRFLRQGKVKGPPTATFEPGFIDRLRLEHDSDGDTVGNARVLAMLTGEATKDDMLDSLMTELKSIREEKEMELKNTLIEHQQLHGFDEYGTIPLTSIVHAKSAAKQRTHRRRKSSLQNPEDVAAAQASAKAAIQETLEKVHEKETCIKNEADRPASPTCRPSTPNIIWRETDRVQIAQNIPQQLLTPHQKMRIVKKKDILNPPVDDEGPKRIGYGAWYMPPKEWGRELKNGSRKGSTEALHDSDRSVRVREQIPKLLIAREYRNFILSRNSQLPSYLNAASNDRSSKIP